MRTNIFATSAENLHTTQRRLNYFQQKMCVSAIGYDVSLGYIKLVSLVHVRLDSLGTFHHDTGYASNWHLHVAVVCWRYAPPFQRNLQPPSSGCKLINETTTPYERSVHIYHPTEYHIPENVNPGKIVRNFPTAGLIFKRKAASFVYRTWRG